MRKRPGRPVLNWFCDHKDKPPGNDHLISVFVWILCSPQSFSSDIIAADQERDRRQTCLPTGSPAAAAGCEARSALRPADGNTRRLLPGAERPATTT